MALFDRFERPKRTCEDPVFGRLEYDNRSCWNGTARFGPVAGEIAVSVVTGGAEPDEAHRALFIELGQRCRALQPAIAKALFDLWESHPEEWPALGVAPGGVARGARAAPRVALKA